MKRFFLASPGTSSFSCLGDASKWAQKKKGQGRKKGGRRRTDGSGGGMLGGMGNGRRRYRHPFFQRKGIWGASTNQLARPLSPPKVKEAEWAAPPLSPKAPATTTTTQKHPPRVEKNGATRITMRRGRLGTGNGERGKK